MSLPVSVAKEVCLFLLEFQLEANRCKEGLEVIK